MGINMKKIFVIGSINTDLVISASKMPVAGETITGGSFFVTRGGKGANQAVAAARFCGDVSMCGRIGDDTFGKDALESLIKENIDASNVRVSEGCSGGVAVITVIDGNNRIILDKGANALLSKSDVDVAFSNAKEGDVLLTQAENPVEVIGYALKKAKEKAMTTIFNPAPADKAYEKYFAYCDFIIPNETEVEIFGGLNAIKDKTDAVIIITLGDKGYAINDKKGCKTHPCAKVAVKDTTAAGDTFCGVFAVCIAEGNSVEESAETASIAASLACTKAGAQPSIPTKKEVIEFARKT